MKHYYLIDNNTSESSRCDEIKLNSTTAEDAIASARLEWEHLTYREQKKRDAFFVVYCEEVFENEDDTEGFPDLDASELIYDFKKEA